MAITTADIKLMASARMLDSSDGGGRMSGTALQDGAENNIFPDLSSLNRAQGLLQFRKVFPAVLNSGADTLLGSHVVLDDTPDDADVFSVLIPATSDAQDQASLVATLNAAGENYGYKGQTTLTASASAAASVLSVSGLRTPFVPKTITTAAASGSLATETVSPTVTAWEPSGQTVALAVSGSTLVPATSIGQARMKPGSVTGTYTTGSGSGTITSDLNGGVTLSGGGLTATLSQSSEARSYTGATSLASITGITATADVLVEVALPSRSLKFATVSGQTTYSLSLPTATAINSVSLVYIDSLYNGDTLAFEDYSVTVTADKGKETFTFPTSVTFHGNYMTLPLNSATLNRATGVLTLVFQSPLPPDRNIVVTFANGGQTSALPSASLVSSGLFASGSASVTIGGGLVFGGAAFQIVGGESVVAVAGVVKNSSGVVRGSVSTAGVMTVPGNDGRTISNWYAAQRNPAVSVSSFDGTLPTALQPTTLVVSGTISGGSTFTSTANSAGLFSSGGVTGSYNAVTGALSLIFSAPVDLYTLAYAATRNLPLTSTADLHGLTESVFATDGTVPIFRVGDVVVLQNNVSIAAATYANGNTVNCGRTDLASVRLIGANGASILTGWTVDLVTGIVSISSISGWSQPVVVRHTIEHMAVVSSLPSAQSVALNRALTRSFASGSVLASAMVLGDLAVWASAAFSQSTWAGVWSDSRIGSAISAQYQQLSNPLVMRSDGAINERWAIIFTTSTQFNLVGETLGQIVTGGTVNTDLVPINPATSQPYFTLAALGWGSGWSAGNVLRFNTRGANSPAWVARVVRPSAPSASADSLTLAIRGDINA